MGLNLTPQFDPVTEQAFEHDHAAAIGPGVFDEVLADVGQRFNDCGYIVVGKGDPEMVVGRFFRHLQGLGDGLAHQIIAYLQGQGRVGLTQKAKTHFQGAATENVCAAAKILVVVDINGRSRCWIAESLDNLTFLSRHTTLQ